MSEMKAAVSSGAGRMETATVPRPECGPGEILLQVAACAINGSDACDRPGLPIPGRAPAGVVADIGLGAQQWRPGNRLAVGSDVRCGVCHYCRHGLFNLCDQLRQIGRDLNGGLAEYILLSREIVDHGIINKVPDTLGLVSAALAGSIASALSVHEDLGIERLETVALVHCGTAGILHAELLQAIEASVIMVDSSPALLERAEQDFGLESTINSNPGDPAQAVVELTEGLGADVVITTAHLPQAVESAISMTRKRGRVAVVRASAGERLAIDIGKIHAREIRLMGCFSYPPTYHARALDHLASGAINWQKLVTAYGLDEASQALQDMRDGAALQAVILPNGSQFAAQ